MRKIDPDSIKKLIRKGQGEVLTTPEEQARHDYGGADYWIDGEIVMERGRLVDSQKAREWWERVKRAYRAKKVVV